MVALAKLREAKDLRKVAQDLTDAYPDSSELDFLMPDPLADVEAHLKASKHFFPLKTDGFLAKVGETHALIARPLADTMSGSQPAGRRGHGGAAVGYCEGAGYRVSDRGISARVARLLRLQGPGFGGKDREGRFTARVELRKKRR